MIINDVKRGDIIRDPGHKEIEVRKVELNACSSRGVHINDKYCWDSGWEVQVTRPDTKVDVSYIEFSGDPLAAEFLAELFSVPVSMDSPFVVTR